MRLFGLATTLIVMSACSTPPVVVVDVLAPTAGEEFNFGTGVLLDAAITADGLPVDVDPTWTAQDWNVAGNTVVIYDLEVGTHDIDVEAWVEDGVGTASVSITIVELPPEPIDYTGSMDVTSDVTSPLYTGTVPCADLGMSMTLQPEGDFSGSGACDPGLIAESTFDITGMVAGNSVTGEMALPDNPQTLAFTGTKAADGTITVTFDETFTEGAGTLRIYGSWTAGPTQ